MKTMVKIKQSETVIIKRSQIHFAAYNPRKKDMKVIESLKKNFKKVGFLGGIVWNIRSGNLVGGHKRVETMDLIFDYPKNDYDIKVEQIDVDDKTEKEQNIFLNNKRVQGETDFELLALVIPDIDIDSAGLTDYDISIVESLVPEFHFSDNTDIINDSKELRSDADKKKEKIKKLKSDIKKEIGEKQIKSYFTVTFKTYEEKAEFLETYSINGDTEFITGESFIKKIT
jgi:hypothetical protein